jgi:GT2 family glycosyltransferase
LIENKENLGSAKARNQGISIAKGDWILFLDCDTVLENDFINKIIRLTEWPDDSIGMFQPKILKRDRKTIYSCGIHLSKLRRFYDIGKDEGDNERFNKSRHVFGACSAAALYKRQMLKEIKEDTGYFDERFFFLVEDVDLAWRVQKRGWKAKFYPQVVCYHDGNSSGCNREFRQYLAFRNRYLLMLKNETIRDLIRWAPLILIYDLSRLFYLLSVNRYTLKALGEIIHLAPKILERR